MKCQSLAPTTRWQCAYPGYFGFIFERWEEVETHHPSFVVCVCDESEGLYILYTDGEISLEVVEVLRQLIAVVIVGEEALKKCQQLRETKQRETDEKEKGRKEENEFRKGGNRG